MIDITNYSFYYKKEQPVLSNLDITLDKGKIYGLFGINGCGKTTLLHAIAGVNFPKEGKITVSNLEPKKRQVDFYQDLFFVPDAVEMPKFTIASYTKHFSSFYPNFSKKQLDTYLEAFEVTSTDSLSTMSFGQQKKFHLAFAMACNTSVLLLDEPTNGLDIPSKEQFRKIILRHIDDNKLVIISTHQARDLDQVIDHVLLIHEQEILVNQSLYELSNKLKYSIQQETAMIDTTHLLHHKNGLHGLEVLEPNINGDLTDIPLEFFIQASMASPSKIKTLLHN